MQLLRFSLKLRLCRGFMVNTKRLLKAKWSNSGVFPNFVPGSFPTRFYLTLPYQVLEPLLTIYEFNNVHLISKTSRLSTFEGLPGTESKTTSPNQLKWFQLLGERVSIIFQIVLSITVMSEGFIGDTSPWTPEVTAQESWRIWTNQKAFPSL